MNLKECLKYADETKELVLGKNALEKAPSLLDAFFPADAGLFIISDENTEKAAGIKLREILDRAGKKTAGSHIFPGEPRLYADYEHVRFLVKKMKALENIIPVSIGAGTINDIVKCASSELGLEYFCVPTAASVDGFTPNGAALLKNGYKQTISCPAPKVVAADTDIIASAPAYLASSGFGDLASKIIAGTDWIIAETAGKAGAVNAPPMDKTAWAMTQDKLSDALEKSVDASRGSRDAIEVLFSSLAITGFSMQYFKNSRPVSGAEHLFSHVWEMENLSLNGVPYTHGHKVAIGTLAATAFTEIFFCDPAGPPEVSNGFKHPDKDERKAEVFALYGSSPACENITNTNLEKLLDDKTAEAVNRIVRDTWNTLREKVQEKLMPYSELKKLLERAGCPNAPAALGLKPEDVIAAAYKAQMITTKYTILDLAWDMGNFRNILAKMENSNLYLR